MTINWEVIIWTCITLAVLMSVIGLILYAISAKNVRSKRKELGEVHTELKVGSRIMFAGGVYGKVVGIDDEDTLRVEVAPKVVITISRYAVQSITARPPQDVRHSAGALPFVQQKAGADIPKDIRSRCDFM